MKINFFDIDLKTSNKTFYDFVKEYNILIAEKTIEIKKKYRISHVIRSSSIMLAYEKTGLNYKKICKIKNRWKSDRICMFLPDVV